MGEIVPFVFRHDQEETQIRTLKLDGKPWFVTTDCCQALALEMRSGILRRLKAAEKGTYPIWTPGGHQQMGIVNRNGLTRLVMRSDKPQATPFQDWIIEEVIPAILDTGKYELPVAAPAPDLLAAINGVSAEMKDGFRALGEKIDGSWRHNFSAATVRYVCVGLATTNGGRCWYCNDTIIVDKYGVRLDGVAHVHHANGNKADTRTENCMLACLANDCHARLTYPSRSDHIPAFEGIALAFGFHKRLRQANGLIRPPDIPKDLLEFRPMKQADMGFRHLSPPASWKRSA